MYGSGLRRWTFLPKVFPSSRVKPGRAPFGVRRSSSAGQGVPDFLAAAFFASFDLMRSR